MANTTNEGENLTKNTVAHDEIDGDDIRDGEKDHEGAEDDADGAEEATDAERPLDALPVLAALQVIGADGCGVDELQREIEAAGSGQHPRGVIWAVLQGLVSAGKVRQTGADEGDARFWLAAPEDQVAALDRRKALVLTIVRAESDEGWVLGDLLADAGFKEEADARLAEGDVEALVAAGVLGTNTNAEDGLIAYGLTESTTEQIEELGVLAVLARAGLTPEADAPAAPADRTQFERDVEALYEKERAQRLIAEARMSKVERWLDKNGLDVEAIIAPEAAPEVVTGEPYPWTQSRKVDDAERGRMFKERVALDEKKALAKAKLDAAKAAYSAEAEKIDGEVEELVAASRANERIVVIDAKKIPDWEAKVFRIVAVDDGRELDIEPMPRGTQRPLLELDGAPASLPSTTATPDLSPAGKEAVKAFVEGMEAKGLKVSASREVDKTPSITITETETSPLVDVATLSKPEATVYGALKHAGCAVAEADLSAAAQAFNGIPVGPGMGKHLVSAAATLAERGVVVAHEGTYRLVGTPAVKASTKSSRDLIWDALTSDGKLKSELRDATGVSDEQVDRAIKELQKAGKVTTSGKARGTRYARAGGSSQAEVRA